MCNKLWRLEPGWLAAYTEDRELIRRIKRSEKQWTIMADYFKHGRLIGVQFRIPSEKRRSAEGVFGAEINADF